MKKAARTVRRRTERGIVLIVAWVVAIGVSVFAAGGVWALRPRRLELPPQGWALPGRDYANSRTVRYSRISTRTIADLDVAWSVPLPGGFVYGNASTTPVILRNTVYLQDLLSNVWAIDLDNGNVRWTHTYGLFQIGPNGVVVGYGLVYVVKGSDEIAALDQETGDEVWATKITATATDGVDIQPTIVAGLVLASTVPVSIRGQFAGGDRGVLWALDARTGAPVWTFDTIADPGLWGMPSLNSGGGAWYPPAIDRKRGLSYWGIGNPAPFPGTPEFPNGSSRPGDNLYTDSVVAIDVRTGALAWHHQASPHDLFDHDLQLAAIATIGRGARRRQVVIGTGKGGRVLGLDPDSGDLLWSTPVGAHQNDDLTELTGPTEVLPGLFGGVLTPPAVAHGTVYAATINAPSTYAPDLENFFGGAPLGVMPGQMVAIDAQDGSIEWDTQIDGDPLGGALVVSDLVFTGTNQGTIVALDRKRGTIVRTIAAPGGINAWPAATTDTIVWPIGRANPPVLNAYRIHLKS